MTIHLRADQVVSGLALTFLGSGLARVLGEGLSNAGATALLPRLTIPLLSQVPVVGPIFFRDQSILVYVGYLLVPLAWFWINRTRPGLHLRAVGEYPAAADAQGIDVYRLRYVYVVRRRRARRPGRRDDHAGHLARAGSASQTTSGRGWIAVGPGDLRPVEPAPGRVRGVPVRRRSRASSSTSRASPTIFGVANPFQAGRSATFFLEMLPYLLVILVVVLGSREAARRGSGRRPRSGRRTSAVNAGV